MKAKQNWHKNDKPSPISPKCFYTYLLCILQAIMIYFFSHHTFTMHTYFLSPAWPFVYNSTNLSSGTAPKSFDFSDDNTEYFIHTFTHALKHDHGSGYSQGGIAHGKHFSKHSIWSAVAITNQSEDHQCIIKRTCMEYYGFINHYSISFGMYQISGDKDLFYS